MRRLLFGTLAIIAVLAAPLGPATGATETTSTGSNAACATALFAHSRPYLTGLVGSTSSSHFYAGPEGGTATATLTVSPAETCDSGTFAIIGRAFYSTSNGSAVAPADYEAITQTLSEPMCVEGGPPPHDPCPASSVETDPVTLDLAADPSVEGVETFRFVLTRDPNSTPLSTNRPTEALVHVIDADGSARVSLEPTLDGSQTKEYVAPEQSGNYHIPVFWLGPTPTGSVPFTIGSVPGFPQPTAGEDYNLVTPSPLPSTAFTHADGRVAFIQLRILNDNQDEPDEAFSITLTGANAEQGRHTTTVTIPDAGVDSTPPTTRFHHPRQGLKYRRGDYRILEFHTYYQDDISGIVGADTALRRKMKNGKCAWWRGARFRSGPCGKKIWKKMKHDQANFLFYYRMKPLKPTVGTNIRHYRAWTRGRDFAGNVENTFKKGRNLSTFWVKSR